MKPNLIANPQTEILYEKELLRGRFVVFSNRPDFDVLTLKQIHSKNIFDENHLARESEGDGIIGEETLPKAILTADCLPLVLLGKKAHAVIHAGWQGLAQGILTQKVLQNISPIYAFVGPHIQAKQYEVQSDFQKHFLKYPEAFIHIDKKTYFDLSLVAQLQLKSIAPDINFIDCGICTFLNKDYSSYRRNKTTNRNWNIYFP